MDLQYVPINVKVHKYIDWSLCMLPGACLDVLAEVALTLDDVAIGSTTVVTTSTPLKRPISTIDVVEVQRVPKITVTRHRASGSDSIKKIRVVPREGHLSHAFHQTVACEEEYGEMVEKLAGV
jgi:hypothetical protein